MPEYNAQNFWQASDTEFELVLIRLAQLGVELHLDRGEVLRVLADSADTLQKTIKKLKDEHEEHKKSLPPFKRPPFNIRPARFTSEEIEAGNKQRPLGSIILPAPIFPESTELSEGDRQWLE